MLVQSFRGDAPRFRPGSFAAPNATAVGAVTVEEGVTLWYGAVVRGDVAPVFIGQDTNVQDNAVLHVGGGAPLTLGRGVTVGHGAIVHGCTVEDDCLIGMGAILLNHCVIGAGSIVAAGAVVTEGTVVPPGSLVMGCPAKVRRLVTEEELAHGREGAQRYRAKGEELLEPMG